MRPDNVKQCAGGRCDLPSPTRQARSSQLQRLGLPRPPRRSPRRLRGMFPTRPSRRCPGRPLPTVTAVAAVAAAAAAPGSCGVRRASPCGGGRRANIAHTFYRVYPHGPARASRHAQRCRIELLRQIRINDTAHRAAKSVGRCRHQSGFGRLMLEVVRRFENCDELHASVIRTLFHVAPTSKISGCYLPASILVQHLNTMLFLGRSAYNRAYAVSETQNPYFWAVSSCLLQHLMPRLGREGIQHRYLGPLCTSSKTHRLKTERRSTRSEDYL